MKQVYLLTGRPGTGKTSLIRQAVARIKGEVGGFYTEEIRNQGAREGFRLVTLDGQNAVLAHININSPYRVSKYGVNIDNLDKVGVHALQQAAEECDLIVIDEIGKMELFSSNFRRIVSQIIDSDKQVLGTIMLNPNPWADAIKLKSRVKIVTVTRTNHPQILEKLLEWLNAS